MRRPVSTVIVGLVTLLPALAVAGTGAAPPVQREAAPASEGAEREVAPSPDRQRSKARTAVRGSSADELRYAEKSRRSEAARQFRAGDDVVIAIGATTLTIILAIVLILVLL